MDAWFTSLLVISFDFENLNIKQARKFKYLRHHGTSIVARKGAVPCCANRRHVNDLHCFLQIVRWFGCHTKNYYEQCFVLMKTSHQTGVELNQLKIFHFITGVSQRLPLGN